ncbi:MAG: hypothetical protein NT042_03575 [Sulfuritalea sp.]|nr:hypothetical protein [Sulfuritalea sp.]
MSHLLERWAKNTADAPQWQALVASIAAWPQGGIIEIAFFAAILTPIPVPL